MDHTVTLNRNDNRVSDHYGDHFYVERSGETVVKIEYLGTRDRDDAYVLAQATARLYGAEFIDRRSRPCLDGWSSD